jgi:mRNA interferase RelE/StbE
MKWRIVVTPTALKMLSSISDRRVREKIVSVIDRLTDEPDKQGKPLVGELAGLRSIRAVGQRYRVVYRLVNEQVVVTVVAVAIRRDGAKDDIYQLAKKLIKLRLLDN